MSQEDNRKNAEIAKLAAERRKLELESEEIQKRLKRWYVGWIGQTAISSLVAAGLLVAWAIQFFYPLLTADVELEKRKNAVTQLKLTDTETSLEKQRKQLTDQLAANEELRTQLEDKDHALQRTINELEQFAEKDTVPKDLREAISALVTRNGKLPSNPKRNFTSITLRTQPTTISADSIYLMIRQRAFSLPANSIKGDFRHDYVEKEESGKKMVEDRATGLMWQQSGSMERMSYSAAETFVGELNRKAFAGYTDWRLPTIEELASLVEPKQVNGALYIDSKFDSHQTLCRSADKADALNSWGIVFFQGALYKQTVDFAYYVRAVRSISFE